MALVIEQPSGDQPCKDGEVCVKGSGAIDNGQPADRVCVKIYQPPNEPANPSAGPPSDAVCVVPNPDGTWCIGMVPGANCSKQQPYPDNEAWVWAGYSDDSGSSSSSSSGTTWQVASQVFQGKGQDTVPECCT